jgi:hypothetical protein
MYIRLKVLPLTTAGFFPDEISVVFDQSGGTIGRSTDSDWMLPGTDAWVSSLHAEIFYAEGSFHIRDKSANGIYLNSSDTPIRRDQTAVLHQGDRINIGGCLLEVEISGTPLTDSRPNTTTEEVFEVEQTSDLSPSPFELDEGTLPSPESMDAWSPEDSWQMPELPPAEPLQHGTAEALRTGKGRVPADHRPLTDPFSNDNEQVDLFPERPSPPDATPPRPKRIDTVDFAVFGPQTLVPGHRQIIDVWAYGAGDFENVKAQAAQVNRDQVIGRKAGLPVWHEAIITLKLSMPGVEIADPSDRICWRGRPANASFAVAIPADIATSELIGTVHLSIDGVPFGKITFVAQLQGAEGVLRDEYDRKFARIHKAFASYASTERAEVLARLQGMRAVCPDLDVFLDVLSLRAGDDWETRLREEVPTRDAFYLFWSQEAASSEWVTREWRMALDERGLKYIVPVPLQHPHDAPPPGELSRLHFNDAYLDHIEYLRLRQHSGEVQS